MHAFHPFRVALSGLLFGLILGCQENPAPPQQATYQWPLRADFPRPEVPATNPMSEAKVALGRQLFYDQNLSANQTQACASCHLQAFGFAEPRPQSIGSTGDLIKRNALALVNIAYNKNLTWAHPNLTTIEAQLLIPMFSESPIEMGITGHEAVILERLNTPAYQALFTAAFGEAQISFLQVNQALASFVRSLVSFNSPFDRYAYDGIDSALDAAALRGMNLFFSEKLECHHCHGGFNFTQSTVHEKQRLDRRPFHNTGLYFTEQARGGPHNDERLGYPGQDRGLIEITLKPEDDGKFRAPTLRNIALTAPYMHDGSVATLTEVIDIYAAGGRHITSGQWAGDGRAHPVKSQFIKGFNLTDAEKQDLLAFLNALTDESFITNPAHADPNTKQLGSESFSPEF